MSQKLNSSPSVPMILARKFVRQPPPDVSIETSLPSSISYTILPFMNICIDFFLYLISIETPYLILFLNIF